MAQTLEEYLAEHAPSRIPPQLAQLLAQSNASLPAWAPLSAPKWGTGLSANGYTILEGPMKGQSVIDSQGPHPVGTYAHEGYHQKVLANGGMPPTQEGRFPAGAIGSDQHIALIRRMQQAQPAGESGPYWGMNPSKSAEEQIASIMGYEGGLPKGTDIMQTPLGQQLLPNQAARDFYFNQSSVPYGGMWQGQAPQPGSMAQLGKLLRDAFVRAGFNTVNR